MWASAALVTVAGCASSESPARSTATVRDSAGITIVENRDPAWTEDTRWTVDSPPSLAIGLEDGDPQREFFKLTDARRLSDGRIAAANASSDEIRYYSAGGEYLCTSGRPGQGPGEFERLTWLQLLRGDTLLAYSWGSGGKLSLIDPNGRFVRTVAIPRVDGEQSPTPKGMLANGALLLQPARSYGLGSTSGTYRDSSLLVVARPGGGELARLGPLPSNERAVLASGDSWTVTAILFSKHLVLGFGPEGILVGTNDQYEIAHYDTAGRLTRLLRLDRAPEPVTASAIAQLESLRLAYSHTEAERAMNRQFFEQAQYASTMPWYSGILVDDEENLWVSRYSHLPVPTTWDVFDPGGQLLGEVRMPRDFNLRQIAHSELVGIARDAMEIERVKTYRIRKGAADRRQGRSTAATTNEAEVTPSRYRACTGENQPTD
jgi:hypothetical protein